MKIIDTSIAVALGLALHTWASTPSTHNDLLVVGSYDQTDDTENKIRSGMKIYIDYGTGNQYLGTASGGLTPRLDESGEIINMGSK